LRDITSWPLPRALGIDQVLADLSEHAGFYINDDDFDVVMAEAPHLGLPWLSAAGRYANADYQLQLLQRPIDWMRDEIGHAADHDIDDIGGFVNNLRRLLDEHSKLVAARAAALRDFTAACRPLLTEALVLPDERTWREVTLIAHGQTQPTTVRVPQEAEPPWPLVKASPMLIDQLTPTSRPHRLPEPGFPVVRKVLAGVASLDHDGTWQRLLPDPDGWYWLRGFAWTEPAPPEPATTPEPAEPAFAPDTPDVGPTPTS
jgi:hypothetical protein